MSDYLPDQAATRQSGRPWKLPARRFLPPAMRRRAAITLQRVRHFPMRFTPRGRAALSRLAGLRDVHRGETAAILGNGPSIKGLDLQRLDGMPTFCLNRGYLLWEDFERTPTYLVAVNDLVIEQFHREIAALACPLFIPWRHRALFDNVSNVILFEARWDERFMTDVTKGVAPCATVTNVALQIAYHMGFSMVVLLGIDHRFATNGTPHTRIRQEGDDPNHFRSDYFGEGTQWNLPDLEQSKHGYARARAAYEADGRRIVNATPDSALEVFEQVSPLEAGGDLCK